MALVNGAVVTKSDLDKFRANIGLRKELDPFVAFLQIIPKNDIELRDFLIQEALITQKFTTPKEEVDAEIQSIMKRNGIDEETLRGVLRQQGVKFETYTELMTTSLSKRKLMERELRPLSAVTPDEIKNYYYTAPEFVERKRKQELLLSYGLVQVQLRSRGVVDELTERLRSGEDFEAAVNRYVDRGASQTNLGVLREDKLAEPIRKSLEGLKVGESSTPLELPDGSFVIHRVISIGAPHDPEFDREKAKIEGKLYQRALERQLQLWTARERSNAYVHVPE